jgi:hypothetical protein
LLPHTGLGVVSSGIGRLIDHYLGRGISSARSRRSIGVIEPVRAHVHIVTSRCRGRLTQDGVMTAAVALRMIGSWPHDRLRHSTLWPSVHDLHSRYQQRLSDTAIAVQETVIELRVR